MKDEQIAAIVSALRSISHGQASGPTGLEAVAMSLAKSNEPSVTSSLAGIAEATQSLADAVDRLSGVIDHHGSAMRLRPTSRPLNEEM